MELKITGNFGSLERVLLRLHREQLPFAASRALNDTAKECQRRVTAELPQIFDRPTPTTMKSILILASTKENLEAVVFIKDFIGKGGSPPSRYLAAEETGGLRRDKRSERALMARGIMRAGQSITPGQGAPLDQYGNIPGSVMVKILSQIGGFGEQGYAANATAQTRRRLAKAGLLTTRQTGMEYFVARDHQSGGNLGVYQIIAPGRVKQVLHFTQRAASYRERFQFKSRAGRVAREVFAARISIRFAEAVRSSR
jgi:hypothetical protein